MIFRQHVLRDIASGKLESIAFTKYILSLLGIFESVPLLLLWLTSYLGEMACRGGGYDCGQGVGIVFVLVIGPIILLINFILLVVLFYGLFDIRKRLKREDISVYKSIKSNEVLYNISISLGLLITVSVFLWLLYFISFSNVYSPFL